MTTVVDPAVVAPAAPAAVVAPVVAPAAVVAPVVAPAAVVAPVVAPAAVVVAPVVGAPEAYADFTLPEGVTLDSEVVAAFGKTAKALNLPQDKAQQVISEIAPVLKARGEATVTKVRADMLAASKADKDIGGDKFDTNVGLAKLAMETHFSKDFNDFLNQTGLGNHPEMIRGLAKIGKPLAPDGWVPGSKDAQTKGDARGLYPNSAMNA